MPYEDKRVFAVWSPSMASAVMSINRTASGDLLRQIVPGDSAQGGYWLIYKADSQLIEVWRQMFPDALTLPR